MSAQNDKLAAALREFDAALQPNHLTLQAFRAILARHGLAVLPVEPTPKMVECGQMLSPSMTLTECYELTRDFYRAMLAAAQEDSTDA